MSALVKTRNGNTNHLPGLPSWIEEWFGPELNGGLLKTSLSESLPAVNIQETPENYLVEVAAPGLQKSDFHINLENRLLTISSRQKEEKNLEEGNKYTRREFSYSSFKRTFTLPETVLADKINAKYEQGLLLITLPKKEEAKQKPPREIKIS